MNKTLATDSALVPVLERADTYHSVKYQSNATPAPLVALGAVHK